MEEMNSGTSSASNSMDTSEPMDIPVPERKFDVRFYIHRKLHLGELLKYLKTNPHIEILYIEYINFRKKHDEILSSILNLDLFPLMDKDADDESVEYLTQQSNLTDLSLVGDCIDEDFVKFLFESKCFHNIKRLELSSNTLEDPSICALADSPNFPNLTDLVLRNTNVDVEGATALALSDNLKNLQIVDLDGTRIDKLEDVEELANITYKLTRPRFKLHYFIHNFYGYLRKVFANKMSMDKTLEGAGLGSILRFDRDMSLFKYVLSEHEKYQLRLNRVLKKSTSGTFYHFLNQRDAETFLFERGALPAAISEARNINQGTEFLLLIQESEEVKVSPVDQKSRFFTKYLVESVKITKEEKPQQIVNSFLVSVSQILRRYKTDTIRLKLLNFKDNEEIRLMKQDLCGNPLSSDKEVLGSLIYDAEILLKGKHKTIGLSYSFTEMQYHDNVGEKTITLPQCIWYVKLFIDTTRDIPLEQLIDLLVTAMEQNPNLVKDKLKKGNLKRQQIYEWVKNMKYDNVVQLFKIVSGLDIEQIWREHKVFDLLKRIYDSKNAYLGGNNSFLYVWNHIVESLQHIDCNISDLYEQYVSRERNRERFMATFSRDIGIQLGDCLARKLIEYAALRPAVRKSLEEFVSGSIDMKNYETITFEQQKIFAQLHRDFIFEVKLFMNCYERDVPTEEEYNVVIENVLKSKCLQEFAKGVSPF